MPGHTDPHIGIIGVGRLGAALATALAEAGHSVCAIWSRTAEPARLIADGIPGCTAVLRPQAVADVASFVFIAISDDAIQELTDSIEWRADHAVVHCSGALDLGVLGGARGAGAATGSFHPLQSFTEMSGAGAFRGIAVAIEADAGLGEALSTMALDLGARPLRILPGTKALYHAAAVMASNYLVTLSHHASELMSGCGLSREEAIEVLIPLMRGTLDNIAALGPVAALTGPIARGDVNTVGRHLEALTSVGQEAATMYAHLGRWTLAPAREGGTLSSNTAALLEIRLTQALDQERTAPCA